jgi:serine-type D-Ala-D-Ala carboxypeptidase/endopeptidase
VIREHVTPFAEGLSGGGIVVGAIRGDDRDVVAFGDAPADAIYDVGSISKAFTSVALAEMVNRGEVRLEDPARRYLPDDVPLPDAITLLTLATHTSGLPRMPSNFNPADKSDPYADFTAETLYDAVRATELEYPTGERSSYSNLGYSLLGHALERASGMSYADLIAQRIAGPLGLAETGTRGGTSERRAQGFGRRGEPVPWWSEGVPGAGGISSTIDDLLRFAHANLEPESTPLEIPLRAAQRPRVPAGERMQVGLGWHMVDRVDGSLVVWHNGGTGGFRSFIAFHHPTRTAVAALSNNGGADPDASIAAVLAALIASRSGP